MEAIVFIILQIGIVTRAVLKIEEYLNSLHLARIYAWIFVRGHYLFLEANRFPRRSSTKTVSYEEQIMSKDKLRYLFIFIFFALSLCVVNGK